MDQLVALVAFGVVVLVVLQQWASFMPEVDDDPLWTLAWTAEGCVRLALLELLVWGLF